MGSLLSDPSFYMVAIPAVILVGLSKGGFGGSVGFVGVPLMALVMPPVQAAAILLPILCLMDVVSLWTWRGIYDRKTLAIMLPGSLVGIGLGWLAAALVTADMVRFMVGAVAIALVGRWNWQQFRHGSGYAAKPNRIAGAFWGWWQASPASWPMSAGRPSRPMRYRCASIQGCIRGPAPSSSPSPMQ